MPSNDQPDQESALDREFDVAFTHLSECRIAYEDDPRNPENIAALGAARIHLEDARKAMNAERVRLGLQPRRVPTPRAARIEGEPLRTWQSSLGH